MKKLVASVVTLALALTMSPVNLIAAGRVMARQSGVVSGTATVDGKPLGNVHIRLRNVDNGQLVAEGNAAPDGTFRFEGLKEGTFTVETVAANGTILGVSDKIVLAAGAMAATGVAIGTSAAALSAAGGIGTAVAVGGAVAGGLGTGVIVAGAVAAGLAVTGLTIALNDASASS